MAPSVVIRCRFSPSESTSQISLLPRPCVTKAMREAAIPGSPVAQRTTASDTACTAMR